MRVFAANQRHQELWRWLSRPDLLNVHDFGVREWLPLSMLVTCLGSEWSLGPLAFAAVQVERRAEKWILFSAVTCSRKG
jgi:hypothetical protein